MYSDNLQPFKILATNLSDPNWIESHLGTIIRRQYSENYWFTPDFCHETLLNISKSLSPDSLNIFYDKYKSIIDKAPLKRVAFVDNNSKPLANFHDFFCIMASGNVFVCQTTLKDNLLLKSLSEELISIEPSLKSRIRFVDNLNNIDAIIYNFKDKTTPILTKYFENKTHIFRENLKNTAILLGDETDSDLSKLADSIYCYFGKSNWSVNKIFVPEKYDFVPLFEILSQKSKKIAHHNQFLNNIDYQKSIHLMNKISYMDAGTFLLIENNSYSTPTGVVNYQYYKDLNTLSKQLSKDKEQFYNIFCTKTIDSIATVPYSFFSNPPLDFYYDNVDTMIFLNSIH